MALSWVLPASDVWEAKLNYIKSRLLARMLYPTYKNDRVIKKGSAGTKTLFVNLKKANQRLQAAMTNLNQGLAGTTDAQKEYYLIKMALRQEEAPLSFTTSGDIVISGHKHTQTLYSSPLIKLKFSNLISTADGDPLIGYLDNLAIKPALDAGFFSQQQCEYKLKNGFKFFEEGGQYPKVLNLSCNFNIFHADPLGFDGFTGKPYSQIFNLGE